MAPTTAAMAPKAPTGASHMIIDEDPEDQLLQVTDALEDRLTALAHGLQGEADQQRHQQRLQHDLGGQRGEQRGRDDVQQELGGGQLLGGDRAGALLGDLGGDPQTLTGVDDVADHQTDGQRERRHRQEVDQGEAADLADLRGLADRADAQHDRAEDHRRDHHLDQVDEAGAERLERPCRPRGTPARRRCRARRRR